MVNPLFKPHGASQITVSGAVLTVHMYGHWNLEMRSQAAQEMLQHAHALNATGPWGVINLLHDTVIYSEEVYVQTRQDYAYRTKDSRLRAVAFVIEPGLEGAALMRPRFETLLQGLVKASVFADLASAQAWMTDQLQAA